MLLLNCGAALSIGLTFHSVEEVELGRVSSWIQIVLFSSLAIFLGIYGYIAYYLPLAKGVKLDFRGDRWRTEAPRLVQTATVCMIMLYLSLTVALNQVYSVFSFIVAGIQLAGLVSVASLF